MGFEPRVRRSANLATPSPRSAVLWDSQRCVSFCFPVVKAEDREFLWRLSFSRAEKQLTKFADRRDTSDVVTCRKRVLRTLKRIVEIIKGLDNSRKKEKNDFIRDFQKVAQHLRTVKGRGVKIEKFTTFQVSVVGTGGVTSRSIKVDHIPGECWGYWWCHIP